MSNRNNRGGGGNRYRAQQYQKARQLDWNQFGIFFTADWEKDGVREAYNLINKHLDAREKPAEPTPPAVPEEELDVADALKAACAETSATKGTGRRVKQSPTGVKHCLFFTIDDYPREKITSFTESLVAECQANLQCRFLSRAIPVEDITPDEPEVFKTRLTRILTTHFNDFKADPANEGRHASFAVDFKRRFNDQFERQYALDVVCEIVEGLDPESKVNLTTPDLTVVVHVIRKAVMISCVREFKQRRQFSLKPPGEDIHAKKEETGGGDAPNAGEDDDESHAQSAEGDAMGLE
uniref:THUMP domain-containing protein n=1 Tax=Panagrellus redivivus TaxID=6233 RepID=A0A7E4VWU0_PANRE